MLIALVVAVVATVPVVVRAMPMSMAFGGVAVDQPCQNCPRPDQTGNMNPDKMMPGCQVLACAGTMAILPAPALAHWCVPFRIDYPHSSPARWARVAPAPDPFPPRPTVLL